MAVKLNKNKQTLHAGSNKCRKTKQYLNDKQNT